MAVYDHTGTLVNGTNGTSVDVDIDPSTGRSETDRLWGDDRFALPHVLTHASVYATAKAYWHGKYDEARRHSREDMLAMWNDTSLRGLLEERIYQVVSQPWRLAIPDEKNSEQVQVRDHLKSLLDEVMDFHDIRWSLLNAIWYGRSAVQWKWQWQQHKSVKSLTVDDWLYHQGDKIGGMHDGNLYILIYSAADEDVDLPGAETIVTTEGGKGLVLKGSWKERFCVHRHLVDDADFWESEAGDARHGVGVRSVLYWMEFLKKEWLANITDFVERIGLGLTLLHYPSGDPVAKTQAQEAAKEMMATRTVLLVPTFGDQRMPTVTRTEVPMGGADMLLKLIDRITELQRIYVVGQTMSTGNDNDGSLGGTGKANFARDTKTQIRDIDSRRLDATLTGSWRRPGLIWMMQKYTFPHTIPSAANPDGFRVRFITGLEEKEAAEKLEAATTLVKEFGLPIRQDDLYEAGGFTKPAPGDDVVGGVDPNAPPQDPNAVDPNAPGAMDVVPDDDANDEAGAEEDYDLDETPVEDDDSTVMYAEESSAPAAPAPAKPTVHKAPSRPASHGTAAHHEHSSPSQGTIIAPTTSSKAKPAYVTHPDHLAHHEPDRDWEPVQTKAGAVAHRNPYTGHVEYTPTKPGKAAYAHAHEHLTKRNAPPKVQPTAAPLARQAIQGLHPHNPSEHGIAELVGAPAGMSMQIHANTQDPFSVSISGKSHHVADMQRTLKVTPHGELEIRNDMFSVRRNHRGQGIGENVFSQQVEQAARSGVRRITALSARTAGMNGYKVWPSLGYNAPLTNYQKQRLQDDVRLPEHVRQAQDILDLYQTQEGKDWWSKHGESTRMDFDLHPGSKSMQALQARRQAKGMQPLNVPDAQTYENTISQRQSQLQDFMKEHTKSLKAGAAGRALSWVGQRMDVSGIDRDRLDALAARHIEMGDAYSHDRHEHANHYTGYMNAIHQLLNPHAQNAAATAREKGWDEDALHDEAFQSFRRRQQGRPEFQHKDTLDKDWSASYSWALKKAAETPAPAPEAPPAEPTPEAPPSEPASATPAEPAAQAEPPAAPVEPEPAPAPSAPPAVVDPHAPGSEHELPPLGNRTDTFKIKFFPGRKDGEIGVGYSDQDRPHTYMPQESARHFINDLSGKVEVPPNSGHPVINAVAAGQGEFLGKGDDGVVFAVGDKVAKVSTTVPFHPLNPGHRTPEQAADMLANEVNTNNHLVDQGIPGLLRQDLVRHGDKAFAIRDKLEMPDQLTAEQLDQVRHTMDRIHEAGYVVRDEIQVGLKDGVPYLYDLGKSVKDDITDEFNQFELDSDRFERFARKMGHEDLPLAVYARRMLEKAKESESRWGGSVPPYVTEFHDRMRRGLAESERVAGRQTPAPAQPSAPAEPESAQEPQTADSAGLSEVDLRDPAVIEEARREWSEKGTQSKYFKNWFGDWEADPAGASKVVDEEGKPVVVYHGTPEKEIKDFQLSRAGSNIDSGFLGQGFYFTSDQGVADNYAKMRTGAGGTIIPAYLSVKNPFNWGRKTQGVRALAMRGERLPDAIHDQVIQKTGFVFDPNKEWDSNDEKSLSEAVRSVLMGMGHDGVVADAVQNGKTTREYVAFNPNQIKSASLLGRGTFDPNKSAISDETSAPSAAPAPEPAAEPAPEAAAPAAAPEPAAVAAETEALPAAPPPEPAVHDAATKVDRPLEQTPDVNIPMPAPSPPSMPDLHKAATIDQPEAAKQPKAPVSGRVRPAQSLEPVKAVEPVWSIFSGPEVEAVRKMHSAPVAKQEPMDQKGQNEIRKITLEDGTQGVWKPRSGETEVYDPDINAHRSWRLGVKSGTYYKNEAAYYAMAKVLDMGHLVPLTVEREINGEVGSLQQLAEAEKASKVSRDERFDGPEDLARAAVLDYLAGHLDRHNGNWMLRESEQGKQLVLIDNGLAFPTKIDERDLVDMNFLRQVYENDVPMPELSAWEGKREALENTMTQSGLSPESVQGVLQRFDSLVSVNESTPAGGTWTLRELPGLVEGHESMRDTMTVLMFTQNRLRGDWEKTSHPEQDPNKTGIR